MDRPHAFMRYLVAISILLLGSLSVVSQPWDPNWFTCNNVGITNCNPAVPSLFVDLRADPSMRWYSCLINRGSNIDTCCGFPQSNNNDRCIEFKVLMHPLAQALIFEIPNGNAADVLWQIDRNHPAAPGSPGAKPSGTLEYRINCGATEYDPDEVACLTQAMLLDTVFITFCKPGSNANVYRIRSIRAELDPDLEILAEGCGNSLTVSATDIDVSSITWNNVNVPPNPIYNTYLSTLCCDTTITVVVPKNAPLPAGNILLYEMCADPIGASICPSLAQICTTVQVVVLSPPAVTVSAPTVCPDQPKIATVTNPVGGVIYEWHNSPNGAGAIVGTGVSRTYPTIGNKSVVVRDPTIEAFGYLACAYDTVNFTITVHPVPPAQILGPNSFCLNVNNSYTALDAGAGAFYQWNFGANSVPPVHSGYNAAGRGPINVRWTTCGVKTITLTVISADGCDSTTTFTVNPDIIDPVITCPPNTTILCTESTDPSNTGTATATDNCAATITYNDVIIPGTCPGEFNILRTWTATDPCNNTDQCTQTIFVVDTIPPVVNCVVSNLILECDQNYNAEINAWLNTTMTDLRNNASDNCSMIDVRHNWTGALPTYDCNGVTGLTVIFTVFDECDNETDCPRLIIIDDTQPPVVNCLVTDLILECGDNYLVLINAWITTMQNDLLIASVDACGGPLTVTNNWNGSSVPTLDCNGTTGLPVIFTVTDACGNFTTCNAEIILDDTTPPVVTCNVTNLVLECDQNYIAEITAWINSTESGLESTATDNCDLSLVADNDWDGSTVPTLSCAGNTGLTITFSVTDDCGNVTYCPAVVIIDDLTDPVVPCNLVDLVLECDQDYLIEITNWLQRMEDTLLLVATDACNGPLTADNDWDGTLPTLDCSGNTGVLVTFSVFDACLNETNCTALIILDDTEPPIVNCVVTDLLLECDQDYLTEIQNWINSTRTDILNNSSDDCGALLTIDDDWDGSSYPTFDCDGVTGLLVTFTVTDACGNTTSCTGLVIIDDTTPPIVTFPGDYGLNGCTVAAITDLPFNTTETTITYIVFQGLGGSVTETCNSSFIITYQDIIIGTCPLRVRRLFRVTDECGNVTVGPQIITITDVVPPVIICPVDIINEGCTTADVQSITGLDFMTVTTIIDQIVFNNLDATSQVSDNCGVSEVSYIDNIVQLTCPLIIRRLFTATDTCGLTDTCSMLITVQDTQLPNIICPADVIDEGCDVTDIITYTGLAFSLTEVVISELTFEGLDGQSDAFDICGIREIRYSDVIFQQTCPLIVDRTFTAYDSCGLNRSCTQRITIQDTQAPNIVCPADDIGEGCDISAVASISGLPFSTIQLVISEMTFDGLDVPSEASDLCGILDVRYVDVIIQPSCPLIIERTFTAYDSCGLNTSCVQTITVEDTQVPLITCPAPVDGEGCDVSAIISLATLAYSETVVIIDESTFELLDGVSDASDICGIREITYVDSTANPSCPLIVVRTFTAYDSCGLFTSCTQQITVRDLTPPVITCPGDVVLEGCNEGDLLALTGLPYSTIESFIDEITFESLILPGQVSDNCGVLQVGYIDNIANPSCPLIIERLFTVFDSCGLTDTCTWTITIQDTQIPTIICPDPIIDEGCTVADIQTYSTLPFSIIEQVITETIFDNLDGVSDASDNCGVLEVRYIDVIFQQTCPLIVDRTFTVYDSCGLTSSCTQRITIQDTQVPTITCPSDDIGEGCDVSAVLGISGLAFSTIQVTIDEATFDALDVPSEASDLCGILEVRYVDVITQPSCPLIIERTFTAYDSCGLNTSCVQTITVEDTQVPLITCPAPVDGEGCDVSAIISLTTLAYSETVVIIAESTFELLDGVSDASDICGIREIAYIDSIANPSCPLIVIRTFTAFDSCGLFTSCTQQITVRDLTPPVITCPGNIVLEGCNEGDLEVLTGLPYSTIEAFIDEVIFESLIIPGQVSDNCGVLQVGYIDNIANPSCPLIIQRLFTVYDSCGLTDTCTWTITIQDTQLPTIICPDPVVDEGCSVADIQIYTTLPFSTVEQIITETIFDNLDGVSDASDNCGVLEVRYIDVIFQQTCPLIVDRTFTVYDSCGLTSSCTQRITIQDTQVPTITCPSDDIGEGCDVSAVLGISGLAFSTIQVTIDEATFDALDVPSEASDLCGILEVRYVDVITQPSCPLIIERTFTAYDSCGLNTSCVQTITVEDTQVPLITCPDPVDGEGCDVSAIVSLTTLAYSETVVIIDESTFELLDGVSDASDICGIREIAYIDSIANPSCPLIVIRTFTAFDSCGLFTSCTQQITVRDLTPPVITCPGNIVLEGCNEGDLEVLTGLPYSTIEAFIDEITFESLIIPGQVSDNCGVLQVGYIDNIANPSCPLIIQRLFTVYDSCGLTDTCTWTITIQDTQVPTIICPDPVVDEGCSVADIQSYTTLPFSTIEQIITEIVFDNLDGVSDASDNCGVQEVRYIDVIFQLTCPLIVDRTFTVYDSCGLTSSCTQRITIQDTQAPSIVCPDDDIGEGCDVSAVLGISGLAFSTIQVTIDEVTFDGLDVPSEASDLCGILEVRYFDVITQPSCPLIIERTFTAYDSCGLNTSCLQTIRVEDTQVPLITCPDPVDGEGCDVSAIVTLTTLAYSETIVIIDESTFELLDGVSDASDICGIREIAYIDSIANPSCPLIVIRTFTAFDSCGLFTSCTQQITVRDLTPPVITCPGNIVLEGCNEGDLEVLTGLPYSTIEAFIDEITFENLVIPGQVSDNCGVLEIGYRDVIINASCPLIIQRLYTAYDSCGLIDTCIWTISIDDTTPPVITCLASITEEGCSVSDLINYTNLPFSQTESVITETIFNDLDAVSQVSDICGIREIKYVDIIVQASCPLIVDRTFTASDSCNLSVSCTQRITIQDTRVPTIICPDDVVGEGCDQTAILGLTGLAFSAIEVTIDEATFDALDGASEVTDACGVMEVRYRDIIIQPACPLIIDRIFVVYDSCGLNSTCTQSITIQDTDDPLLICPGPVSGEGCDLGVIEQISGLPLSTSIRLIDAITFASLDGVSEVSDGCGVAQIQYQDVIDQLSCPIVVIRTFTATDSCGLFTQCQQEITIYDSGVPVITCPADLAIEGCSLADLENLTTLQYSSIIRSITEAEFEALDGVSLVDDNCGVFDINYIDQIVQQNCPLIIRRTFIVYDSCDLSATCTQTIQLDPITLIDPVCPAPLITASCLTQAEIDQLFADWIAQFVYTGSGCFLNITPVDTATAPEFCGGSRTILFMVEDQCGNQTSCTSTFTVPVAPELQMSCPPDLIVKCPSDVPAPYSTVVQFQTAGGVFSSTCGLISNSFGLISEQSDGNICPEVITRIYEVRDICGHRKRCTQIITVYDTISPVLVGVPSDISVACEDVPDPPVIGVGITVQDNCDQILPTFSEEILPGLCENTYNIIRTWSAVDVCGNSVSAQQNITVTDCRPEIEIFVNPNPLCLDGSVTFDARITNNYQNPIYRWQFLWNGTWIDLPGGNVIPFVRNNIDLSDAGLYRLLVADRLANIGNFDCNALSEEVELIVLRPVATDLLESICDGDTYVVGSSSYTLTGLYQDVLTGSNGCDSVVNLNLTVIPNTDGSLDTIICRGESILVGSTTLNRAGQFVVHLPNAAGCDSTVFVNLRIQDPIFTNIRDTICEGSSVTIDGDVYSTGGNYTKVLRDQFGCDSTLEITIHEIPTVFTDLNVAICTGDSYSYAGQTFSSTGSYNVPFISAVTGCDSIVVLNLSVVDVITTDLDATICVGDSFQMAGNFYSIGGTYKDTLVSQAGCDSVITLDLAVVNDFVTNLDIILCEGESYAVGSNVYSQTGNYTDLLISRSGCDSTVNLNLIVNLNGDTLIAADICQGESVLAGGQRLSTAGIHTLIIPTVKGCDSTITVDLKVHGAFDTTYQITLCQGAEVNLGGQVYNTTGNFEQNYVTAFGCDSTIFIELEVFERYEQTLDIKICTGSTYVIGSSLYNTTGNYTDALLTVNGCDSIVHLNLSVVDDIRDTIDVQICVGDSYNLGGTSYNVTGSYNHTFISSAGCDSIVTVNLSVLDVLRDSTLTSICAGEFFDFDGTLINLSGNYNKSYISVAGCDSVQTLVLTVIPLKRTNLFEEICEGDVFILDGQTLSEAGTYVDTLISVSGCDSVVTRNLRINEAKSRTISRQICNGAVFDVNGTLLDTSGTFIDTLTTVEGCDSIVTLILQVNRTYNEGKSVQICEGQVYNFDGQNLSVSGQYIGSFQTAKGCDSTVTLNLSVETVLRDTTIATICSGESYDFDGTTHTMTGNYNKNYLSVTGCDSIHTLLLTVVTTQRVNISQEICEGDTFFLSDMAFTQTGIFIDTLVSAAGCDSIVTLNLRVNAVKTTTINRQICTNESFNFNGIDLDSTGIYYDTLATQDGCDSIITLNLQVNPTYYREVAVMICVGQIYTFNGQTLNSTGQYTAALQTSKGCDSTIVLNLEVVDVLTTDLTVTICDGGLYDFFGSSISTAGPYSHTLQSSAGCDSIIRLNLEVVDEIREDLAVTLCEGEVFAFASLVLDKSGVYLDTLASQAGCDSIVRLTLTVNPTFNITINGQICLGTSYRFMEQDITNPGTYIDSLKTASGCDSIVTLNLAVDDIKKDTTQVSICAGESYTFAGQDYNTSGTYEQVVDGVGCDTLKVLVLTVLDIITTDLTRQICIGQTVAFDGQNLASTGTHTITFSSVLGCDSVVTLNLEVVDAIHTNLDYFFCQGDSVIINGKTYHTKGAFTDTLASIGGCDSILHISIGQASVKFDTIEVSICEGSSYTFAGVEYNQSITTTDTISTGSGCDSIVTLNLTVLPVYEQDMTVTICTGSTFIFDGKDYSEPDTYQIIYQTSLGCDSIINLTVVANDELITELVVQNCLGGAAFDFNGRLITEPGIYRDTLLSFTGCDSIVILDYQLHDVIETFETQTICTGDSLLINGQYYRTDTIVSDTSISVMGCDSIAYHQLIVVDNVSLQILDAEICEGESVQLEVNMTGDGASPIAWTPSSGLSCADCLRPIAAPDVTTTYKVSTIGCLGTNIETEVTVAVIPLPILELSQEQSPNGGQQVTLSATTIDPTHIINWYDDSGQLLCTDCPNLLQTINGESTFVAIAVNELGCEVEEQITVGLTEDDCEVGKIVASNAMTPNGDGSNDYFQVTNSGDAELTLIQVINRWGEIVFEGRNIEELWDGSMRGEPVNPGVYVYMLHGICLSGETFILAGNVTVIR
ncbi:MAG: gliding motility-associated C-terminal domain-containing protein [Saprospiraceae bacterium]|nr:gliding motility-associated C-terminal domain-containing protein [Saprospiraceae bacterium]